MEYRTPPDPSDSKAWLDASASGLLPSIPPRTIVNALRAQVKIGHERAANALVKHLSLVIIRRLRAMIGTNHPGYGEPMIEEAHGALMEGLFDPEHGDYQGLAEAFGTRVKYRAIDAIRVEQRFNGRHPSYDAMEGGIEAAEAKRVDGAQGSIEVEHVLARIPDIRKRLAFRLYMNGAQVRAGRNNIADAIGIDPKTAAKWIGEVRATLAAALNKDMGA